MEAASAESNAADEVLLQLLAIAITDVQAVRTQTQKFWSERLSVLLPDTSDFREDNDPGPEGLLICHYGYVVLC